VSTAYINHLGHSSKFKFRFTFSQVPRDVSDAIYGRVQGAYYDEKNQWWLVPCGQYLNISFNFAGINYPIHPLDTVDDNFQRTDATGKKVCIGAVRMQFLLMDIH